MRYFLKLRAYLIEMRQAEADSIRRTNMASDGSDVVDFDTEVLGKPSSEE